MVRPPEASADEDFNKLAALCDHTVLMGCGVPGILRAGSGQQNRIRRQRRSVQPDAAEDHPGGHFADSLHSHGDRNVQGTGPPMEPHRGVLLPGNGSFLRFFEVNCKINLEV